MITQEQIKELFNYDPGTGVLTWKIRTAKRIHVGDNAGSINDGKYLRTTIKNKLYLNHRIIFLFYHGYLPKYLDHIDGNPLNNRILNIRECTSSQNNYNRKYCNNNSGIKGVGWHILKNKWQARLNINGKTRHLGLFENKNDAEQIVRKFREKHHKEFTNHG